MLLETIDLSPRDFMAIPGTERSLLVLLGHAMNEVNVLTKLLLIAGNFENHPRWYAHGQSCQALVLARTLTGKLHETWQFITKGYLRTPLSKRYRGRFDPDGESALKNLKAYFGRKNLVTEVRNQFSFHYSLDHASATLDDETPPSELRIYFGPTNGTSLYQFSEQVMGVALLSSIDRQDPAAAFSALISETSNLTAWLNAFSQRLMYLILEDAFGEERLPTMLKQMKVSATHSTNGIRLPYFAQVKTRRGKGAA